MNLKHKLEALLFSSGRKMTIKELSRLCHKKHDDVVSALKDLKEEYENKHSSLMVIDEGLHWKITVKEEHLPLVKEIVTETELSKTLMETLAVIAMRYPIKQSKLIEIRTNKAYDHLKELEDMSYITRQKYGRTKLIKLTQKFFDYFSLPEEQLHEKFKDFRSLAKAIEEKEEDIEKLKKEDKKRREEEKKKSEVRASEIDLIDDKGHKKKLEIVDTEPFKEQKEVIEEKETLGNLEIVDEPEIKEEKEEIKEEPKKEPEEAEKEPETKEEIKLEEQKKEEEEVDKRVEELLRPATEEEVEEPKKEEKKKEASDIDDIAKDITHPDTEE